MAQADEYRQAHEAMKTSEEEYQVSFRSFALAGSAWCLRTTLSNPPDDEPEGDKAHPGAIVCGGHAGGDKGPNGRARQRHDRHIPAGEDKARAVEAEARDQDHGPPDRRGRAHIDASQDPAQGVSFRTRSE